MQAPFEASEAQPTPTMDASLGLPARSMWGVLGLVLLTVGSLGLAWLFPDATLMHFLWVGQIVPVLYLVLLWWGIQPADSDDDAI